MKRGNKVTHLGYSKGVYGELSSQFYQANPVASERGAYKGIAGAGNFRENWKHITSKT